MSHTGLKPFIAVPKDIREWTRWSREQVLEPGDATVATAALQDTSVTYAKIQDVAADRILGRLTTAGVVSELTASDLVTLLQSEGWAFSGNVGFFGTAAISQPANIVDASVAHSLNPTFDNNAVEGALDNLGTTINSILSTLDSLGLTA